MATDVVSDRSHRHGLSHSNGYKYACDPREIRARLDTPRTRIVLGKGYPLDLVQMALEEQLRSKGTHRQCYVILVLNHVVIQLGFISKQQLFKQTINLM